MQAFASLFKQVLLVYLQVLLTAPQSAKVLPLQVSVLVLVQDSGTASFQVQLGVLPVISQLALVALLLVQ